MRTCPLLALSPLWCPSDGARDSLSLTLPSIPSSDLPTHGPHTRRRRARTRMLVPQIRPSPLPARPRTEPPPPEASHKVRTPPWLPTSSATPEHGPAAAHLTRHRRPAARPLASPCARPAAARRFSQSENSSAASETACTRRARPSRCSLRLPPPPQRDPALASSAPLAALTAACDSETASCRRCPLPAADTPLHLPRALRLPSPPSRWLLL